MKSPVTNGNLKEVIRVPDAKSKGGRSDQNGRFLFPFFPQFNRQSEIKSQERRHWNCEEEPCVDWMNTFYHQGEAMKKNTLFLAVLLMSMMSLTVKADEWDDAISGSDSPAEAAAEPTAVAEAPQKQSGKSSDDLNEAKFDADYENSDYQQLMRDESYYRNEAHKSQNELQQAKTAYKSLKKKNANLQQSIRKHQSAADKQAQLAQAEVNRVSALQDKAKRQESEVERLKAKVEALKQKRDESKQKSQELAQNINDLAREKAQLASEAKRVEKQLARYKLTKSNLSKKHKKLATEVRKLQNRKQARR